MQGAEYTQRALSYTQSDAVRGMINRTLIVEWGTIKEISGKGVVQVLLSVTDKPENATVVTCVLLNPCSKSFALDITPEVGDKVLVLSPRHYDNSMFDVTDDTEVIVNDGLKGYNKMTCVAILFNQFREDSFKNSIKLEGGELEAHLAYDKDNSKNMFNLTVGADGAYSIANDKSTVSVDADGYLSYQNSKDNKTKLEFTSSGMTAQDANECKFVSDNTGIKINGKLWIKK